MKARFNNPFAAEGNWYKGNLHTHTTNSDGGLSPVDTVKQYREAGYHFLALTDHYRLTRVEEIPGILVIGGEEAGCGLAEGKEPFHLVALDISQEIPKPKGDGQRIDPQEFVDKVKAQSGEVILAHPDYSWLSTNDVFSFQGYIGLEVFNTHCSVTGEGYGLNQWDDLLASGRNVFGLAVDDTHNYYFQGSKDLPKDARYSWLMVKANLLSLPGH